MSTLLDNIQKFTRAATVGDGRDAVAPKRFSELRGQLGALEDAISEARKALGGDSNDAEHDALVSLMNALGETYIDIDECNCVEKHSWYGEGHCSACPCAAN